MSTVEIPRENQTVLGRLVCRAARAYFENEEHRRAFEEWYLQNYGKPYVWKGESHNDRRS